MSESKQTTYVPRTGVGEFRHSTWWVRDQPATTVAVFETAELDRRRALAQRAVELATQREFSIQSLEEPDSGRPILEVESPATVRWGTFQGWVLTSQDDPATPAMIEWHGPIGLPTGGTMSTRDKRMTFVTDLAGTPCSVMHEYIPED